MEFAKQLEYYRNKINDNMHALMDGETGHIYDAMRYSLYEGGKRIRPVLTLAVCDAFGGDDKAALCFGCALEMIHTYSLIHDDLPCMDNDDLRRGKPTNHKVFGEAMATLAGDALLNRACETALGGGFGAEITVEALKIIFSASGADGMIGGQVIDMESEGKTIDGETLLTLHRKKTGALINAAVSLGALCAGKDKNILSDYSAALGLAFQIRDDILDVEGSAEKFGKPINSDEKNGKNTFVTLYTPSGAKKRLEEETQRAKAAADKLGESGEFLSALADYLLKRES